MFLGHGNMKILGLSIGHDASACVIENGNIIYYRMTERLSRIKHDYDILPCLKDLIEFDLIEFDTIVVSYFLNQAKNEFLKHREFINQNFKFKKLKLINDEHHLHHAYGAIYASGFNKATVIVLDGSGSIDYTISPNKELREIESIYTIDLINRSCNSVYKHYHSDIDNRILQNNIEISNDLSVGWQFERCSEELGFGIWGAGKVMGLAQYQNQENLLEPKWVDKVQLAHDCQTSTELRAEYLLYKAITLTDCRNIIITGGYGLNCVANFKYTELVQRNKNIFIDPVCFDAGISIGVAFKEYFGHDVNYNPKPLKNVFIGNSKLYNINNYQNIDATDHDIVELLEKQEVVAIFQGNSEAGQRALGNRSILFDPRNPEGQSLVNKIKKRESFRPFGCSILAGLESEWFYSDYINNCAFMSYAIPVREKYKKVIPAVVHIDGTSRIQTLDIVNNKHFYNLVDTFYKKTGVPLLGNTSLNLAGEPLVETLEDAIKVLENSELKYLYLPEIKKLIISQKYSQTE